MFENISLSKSYLTLKNYTYPVFDGDLNIYSSDLGLMLLLKKY